MSSTPSASLPEARAVPVAVAVGTGLAGALIVALALPASTRMEATGLPRWLVAAAVVLAVLTVAAAVCAVVLRSTGRLPALLSVAAGLLLIAATAFTGSAAVAVLAGGSPPAPAPGEGLTIMVGGVGANAQLTMRADMTDVAAGALVRAEVVAVSDGVDGDVRVVVARQLTVARAAGTVSVDLVASTEDDYGMLEVLVESPDRRCTASLRPQQSESPVVSCKPR
jgi:hypothetical protein